MKKTCRLCKQPGTDEYPLVLSHFRQRKILMHIRCDLYRRGDLAVHSSDVITKIAKAKEDSIKDFIGELLYHMHLDIQAILCSPHRLDRGALDIIDALKNCTTQIEAAMKPYYKEDEEGQP